MNIKIKAIKLLDTLIGSSLVFLLSPFSIKRKTTVPPPRARCLIIRPGGIGDAVYLVETLNELGKEHPCWTIDILAEKRNQAAFKMTQGIHHIFLYDRPVDFFRCLFTGYDLVIDSEQWYRLTAVFAFFSAPLRVGFGTNIRRKLFTHPILYSQKSHETRCFKELFRGFTDKREETTGEPFLTIPQFALDNLSSKLPSIAGKRRIVLSVGGSLPEKRWPVEKFAETGRILISKGFAVLLIGGPEDRLSASHLKELVETTEGDSSLLLDFTGKTTLMETAALLSLSDFLVAGDTGVLHIAAALEIPTLAIFGPSNKEKWNPPGETHHVIATDMPCSPCSRWGSVPPCPINGECIKRIEAREVTGKVLDYLEGSY